MENKPYEVQFALRFKTKKNKHIFSCDLVDLVDEV